MHTLLKDLRFTLRQLRKSPGFAATTILTLALGIGATTSLSYPDFFDWRAQNRSFRALASYRDEQYTLTGAGDAQNIQGDTVSNEFFRVLGIHPALGRDFVPADEKAGQHVAMLSHQLWQSTFGSRPDIAGTTITLGGQNYAVAGVMPEGFAFPIQNPTPQLWATLASDAVDSDGDNPATESRGEDMLTVIGRLKPGVTVEQARAEMNVIDRNMAVRYPES